MAIWNFLRSTSITQDSLKHATNALACCRHLIQLLNHLQQHRGTSTAWLAGNAGFESRMLEKRREIDDVLLRLHGGFEVEGSQPYPCFTLNDLRLARFRWAEVIEKLKQGGVPDNIERHNQTIKQVLDWLATLGEARIELPLRDLLQAGEVRNFAGRLPHIAELFGQSRALGSSVATQGRCGPVARVRLNYLITRAETLLNQAEAADFNYREKSKVIAACKAMSSMVRYELLSKNAIQISSEHYFEIATLAINAIFEWMAKSGDNIGEELKQAG